MANTLLPAEERNLTPKEVELLDKRRRRGQLFLVLCVQCLIVGTLVTLWAGQDWTLSPGWIHPMVFWEALAFGGAYWLFGDCRGVRHHGVGAHEFISLLALTGRGILLEFTEFELVAAEGQARYERTGSDGGCSAFAMAGGRWADPLSITNLEFAGPVLSSATLAETGAFFRLRRLCCW